MGSGAAIKIKDASLICNPELVTAFCSVADANKIPYRREILQKGGTDTSVMQLTAGGAVAGALSIPCRYIHSGVEMCSLSDAEACSRIAVAYLTDK